MTKVSNNGVRLCRVDDLITMLQKAPPDWMVCVNTIGNLSLVKKTENEYDYVGYIDLLWREIEMFAENEKRISFSLESEE